MTELLHNWGWLIDLADIAAVTFVIYRLALLLKGTVAVRLLAALILVFVFHFVARLAGFVALGWLVDNLLGVAVLAVIVVFQHDVRRSLVAFAGTRFARERDHEETSDLVEQLILAAEALATKKIGALIVLERGMALDTFLAVGTEIDAKVTSELITSIFLPYSPIHDGAVIIQRGKLTRAGCFLPLTQNPEVSKTFGTRHRAALGLTEIVDAVVVIVSEERGKISVAVGGRITRDLEPATLRKVLTRLLAPGWLK